MSSQKADMTLRYHPILAFVAFYVIGLFVLLVTLALVGLLFENVASWLVSSGYVNVLPLVIAYFAAFQSATANGKPLFRFVGHNPRAVRAAFRKNIRLFALSFGMAAVTADLITVAISAGVGLADGFHYPMTRLLLLGGVYCVVSYIAISSSFGHPMGLAPEATSAPSQDAMPVPVKASDTFLDR